MQTNEAVPAGPSAFGVIAERFRRAGQADKAVALCREGLEKFPEHLSARVTLGWALLDLGEHQEAFDQLKSVLKRAPDNLAAIRGLAELHERGIGLVFDSLPDADHEASMGEIDPIMEPMAELDPVMEPAAELDPVMEAVADFDPVMEPVAEIEPVAAAPAYAESLEDLDPVVEPEPSIFAVTAAAPVIAPVIAPAIEPARFEIEDVVDESGPDSMFDLSGMFDEKDDSRRELELVPASVPAVLRGPVPLFGRAPLALREEARDERPGEFKELNDWLSRIRDRRADSVSQYMAG